MHRLWLSNAIRVGFGAACLAVVTLAVALRGALRQDRFVGVEGSNSVTDPPAAYPAPLGYSLERVLTAVEKDPFNPDRRRPGMRFQLPAEGGRPVEPSRPTDVGLGLVGTAVNADGGGFAMCTWQGGSPKIVRIGEKVGEWTLQKVWPGAAEFVTTGGGTVTVRVPKAGT